MNRSNVTVGVVSFPLAEEVAKLAETTEFSGVVVVEHQGESIVEFASGLADRAHGIPNTLDTRLATASATKGFTALTVASLVDSGHLRFDTPLRTLVEDALPLVDPEVTIEHLLGHTSGVGDYIDEELVGDIDDHVLGVSAHELVVPDDYLPLMTGLPQTSAPGERFVYNNSGYVILSLAIERAGAGSFHDLVRQRVFEPARMTHTAFLRSDDRPSDAAIG